MCVGYCEEERSMGGRMWQCTGSAGHRTVWSGLPLDPALKSRAVTAILPLQTVFPLPAILCWNEVEVNLRLTVNRPVCPDVSSSSGTRDQFFFLLEIPFSQLRLCYVVAPSLTRGRVVIYCTIASGHCQSSHSWVEVPQNSRPYFTVSSKTPPTWRARFPYLYPPGTGWPSYTPGSWVLSLSPPMPHRASVEVF
jgi:hypothetical protein